MKDHPYYEELRYSLELFNSRGFKPIKVDDGEEIIITDDIEKIIECIISVDMAWVTVECKGILVNIFFVLGNEPGVAINDFTVSPNYDLNANMDYITSEIYDHFNQ